MATKKEKFDGITRPSNDTYRKRFDEIFGKKEKIYPENAFSRGIRKQMKRREKTLHEELMEGFRKEQEDLKDEEEQ